MQSADLKSRLARLQGGPPRQRPVDPQLEDLIARIERLRGRTRERTRSVTAADLAQQLGGELCAGGVLRIERRIPLAHRVGRVALAHSLQAHIPDMPADPAQWLFLDTETTGLAGGAGTLVFLVGLGRLRGDAFVLIQYLCTSYAAERAMLAAVAGEVRDGDHLVSFNGKSYDLPLLAGRLRLNRTTAALDSLPHLDLLHALRRVHRKMVPDCKLKTLEDRLLGFRRTDDLPGSQAPLAWQRWLRNKEGDLLARVAKHNRLDVLAMAALMAHTEAPCRASSPHC